MKLFKKRPGRTAPNDALPNPYLNAQRTWNSHVGSLIASRTLWQAMALLAMLIALASVGGVIYIGSQSKLVPYIVEVDKLGEAVAVGPAERAGQVDARIVRALVAEFIANARLVTPDVALQRKAILKVYSMLGAGSAASTRMTAFMNGDPEANPFKRAGRETVTVDIASALRQTDSTWQVEWIETVRNRKGQILGKPYRMRALLTLDPRPEQASSDEEQLRGNPLGLYISDYSWSKQF